MALEPDQRQDGKQDLDANDAVSEKENRAGESDKAGRDDRAGESDKAGVEERKEADDRAEASPAPTIDGETFEGSSYSGDTFTPPASFFEDLGPAPGERRSLREAIWELPEQYIFVVRRPSASSFMVERGRADWDLVYVQLLGTAVIAGLLGLLSMVIPFAAPGGTPSNGSGLQSHDVVHALNLSTTVGLIVFIPVIFFVGSGILRLLARWFGGDGSFLEQCYTTLLFLVPFGVAISVIRLLPFIGGFFFWFGGLAALLYGIVLQILATTAVYDLTVDKAIPPVIITAVILIPITILVFAFLTFIFALAGPIL